MKFSVNILKNDEALRQTFHLTSYFVCNMVVMFRHDNPLEMQSDSL